MSTADVPAAPRAVPRRAPRARRRLRTRIILSFFLLGVSLTLLLAFATNWVRGRVEEDMINDLMDRNMHRRVETCFPIEDAKLRKRIIKDLDNYLKDNTQAWVLTQDGTYRRLSPTAKQKPHSAQQILLSNLAEFS